MLFDKLKNTSNDIATLNQKIKEMGISSDSSDDDKNVWRPAVDKAGNGMATIRFLPAPEKDGDDGLPWVKKFSHGFQGAGGWLIDGCLTTKNKQCPVCEYNSTLWNSGIESNKEVARKQKRKLNYYANVYIISDPKNPENEGTVKLFKFGKKIFDKITEAMKPPFPDEKAINPFDFWKGANFKLKIRKVDGYQNYDKSEFESPSALFDDDQSLERIWKEEHSLKDVIDDSEFKDYEKLKARLDKVIGAIGDQTRTNSTQSSESNSSNRKTAAESNQEFTTIVSTTVASDGDDDLDYFRNLANSDD
jgi:hypothetical protein